MISNQVSVHGEVNRCKVFFSKGFAIDPGLHLDQQCKVYEWDRVGDNTEYIPVQANWLVEAPFQVSEPDT